MAGLDFRGVHHIAISVPSLAAAKRFYVDSLGLECVDETYLPPSPLADRVTRLENVDCHAMMLHAGNLFLEIFEYHHPVPAQQHGRRVCDHGYTHLAFEVDDIQAAYDQLEQAGVDWHHPPVEAGEGYLMTYGSDPFGNVIEIQQLRSGFSYSFEQLGPTATAQSQGA